MTPRQFDSHISDQRNRSGARGALTDPTTIRGTAGPCGWVSYGWRHVPGVCTTCLGFLATGHTTAWKPASRPPAPQGQGLGYRAMRNYGPQNGEQSVKAWVTL